METSRAHSGKIVEIFCGEQPSVAPRESSHEWSHVVGRPSVALRPANPLLALGLRSLTGGTAAGLRPSRDSNACTFYRCHTDTDHCDRLSGRLF